MSFIKLSSSALADIRQERSFESGERVTFVCVVMGYFDPSEGKFRDDETNKTRRQYSFLCADGRKFQLSRLWGSRTTESGRVLAADDASPVSDLCRQLPFNLLDKLQAYLSKCKADGTYSDDKVISAKIEKIPVENGKTGFKDWYRLTSVKIIDVKVPDDDLTEAQKQTVERFATNADVTIDLSDNAVVKWWYAAISL